MAHDVGLIRMPKKKVNYKLRTGRTRYDFCVTVVLGEVEGSGTGVAEDHMGTVDERGGMG
jgi:hypothetical protein